MIAASKGYRFTAVMPESASIERRQILRQFGAEIILTDGARGTNYAIAVAHQLVRENPHYLMLDQFTNEANVLAHYETTGVEIVEQLPTITHLVAGMGTGGTLMGVGRRLRQFNPNIQIIGVEPAAGSKIQGLRNMAAYTPPIFHPELLDQILHVPDEAAFRWAREIFTKEGISVGISSGAALWGAIEVAKTIKTGTILTLFPDRGDRYVSTELFP
jgi:cysteine synthase